MTDFITRLTELAGAETAAKLIAEFGGNTCFIPVAKRHQTPPVRVVLQAEFSATQPIAQVATRLSGGLQALSDAGLVVTDIGIRAQGMGDGYIEALRQQGLQVTAML